MYSWTFGSLTPNRDCEYYVHTYMRKTTFCEMSNWWLQRTPTLKGQIQVLTKFALRQNHSNYFVNPISTNHQLVHWVQMPRRAVSVVWIDPTATQQLEEPAGTGHSTTVIWMTSLWLASKERTANWEHGPENKIGTLSQSTLIKEATSLETSISSNNVKCAKNN